MLVIRKAQIETFQEGARRAFEDGMVVHLGTFSPPLFKALGEDHLRKTIRLGIARAGRYGLTHRGPVRLYLELMLLFGSHFDTDPQYPWATEILTNQDVEPQMQRAERLYERTLDYRQHVAGPEDAYTLQALRAIRARARQSLPFPAASFVPAMLQEITRVYPQKAAYVGAEGIEALIQEGIKRAQSHGFATDRGVALVIVLMLAFGHGCADDPLYPWIAQTLQDAAITDPVARAKRLETKALTWLEHVLAYFAEGAPA